MIDRFDDGVAKLTFRPQGALDSRGNDACLRLLDGGDSNLWTPYALLYHHEAASRGLGDSAEKQARFLKEVEIMRARWSDLLGTDPTYNLNPSRDADPFSISVSGPRS